MSPTTRSKTRVAGLRLDFGDVVDFTAAPEAIPTIDDLAGSVHPIFRRANFDVELNYDLFVPSLKLATKFVTTPALLPFWHTTLFGAVRPADFVIHAPYKGNCYEYLDLPSKLSGQQIRCTQQALLQLRHKIRFHLLPQNERCDASGVACTVLEDDGTVRIYVTTQAVIELAAAARKVRIGGEMLFVGESFYMAKTMCHELAHAACRLTHGRRNCFYPGSPVSEDGWAWESAIFGGQPAVIYLDASRKSTSASEAFFECSIGAYLFPSPSLYFVANYAAATHGIGLRLAQGEPPIPKEPDLDGQPYEAVGVFKVDFYKAMFTEKFWRTEVKNRGVAAFRPDDCFPWTVVVDRDNLAALLRLYENGMKRLQEEACVPAEKEALERLCRLVVERSMIWTTIGQSESPDSF